MVKRKYATIVIFFLFPLFFYGQDDYPMDQFFIKNGADSSTVKMRYNTFSAYFEGENLRYAKMIGTLSFRERQLYFNAYAQLLERRDSLSAVVFENVSAYKMRMISKDLISFWAKFDTRTGTPPDSIEYMLFFTNDRIDSLRVIIKNTFSTIYKYDSQNIIRERETIVNGMLEAKTKYYYLGNEALLLANYIRCEDVNLYKLNELIVLYRTPKRVPEKKKLKMLLKQFDIDISKERQCYEW